MTARPILTVLALWLGLALASAGWAAGTKVSLGGDHDSSLPIEITSEELQVDQEAGHAVFSGGVIVGQGDIKMTCDRMQVDFGEDPDTGRNEIQVIHMFGGVTFVNETDAAEARQAVYTLATDSIEMTGSVLVTQGSTAVSGDRLTYNLKSGEGLMEGRVKTILQPKSN